MSRSVRGIKVHPAADIMPYIEDDDWDDFKQAVKNGAESGTLESIELLDGKIIDGRNRWCALTELGIDPNKFCVAKFGISDPVQYVLDRNLGGRRQLTKSQLGMVAAKVANLKAGSNQFAAKTGEVPSVDGTLDEKIAVKSESSTTKSVSDSLGVSTATIERSRAVLRKGSASLVEAVSAGAITVRKAVDLIKAVESKEEQNRIIAEGKAKIEEAIKLAELQALKASLPGSTTKNESLIKAKEAEVEKATQQAQEEKKKREHSDQYLSAEKAAKKLESKEAVILVGFLIQHFKIRKYKMAEEPKRLNVVLPDSLNCQEFLEAWTRWIEYRRTINKSLKEVGAKKQLEEFAKAGIAASIKAIDESIKQGWTGVFPGGRKKEERESRGRFSKETPNKGNL